MTAPLLAMNEEERWTITPTGFILTPGALITIHYGALSVLDEAAQTIARQGEPSPTALLAGLLEEVVDRAADQLEHVSKRSPRFRPPSSTPIWKRRG
jgi:magnesium transporter